MKTYIKPAIMAIAAILLSASCGNAGARNEKKSQADESQQKSYVTELNTEAFKTSVYDIDKDSPAYLGDKPAIVDFNATWCGPCRRIAPILEELGKEYEGQIVIYKVDVDKCPELAQAFGISSIPALLFIPVEGEPVMTVGSRDKAKFKEQIDSILLKK